MKLKKCYLFSLLIITGLFALPAHADDTVSQVDHPMGYYTQQETQEEASSSAQNTEENETSNAPQARSFSAASASVPSNLSSNDTSLPRRDAVDVSSYQSWMTQADFNSLKASGVKTIIVKLTEGTYHKNPYAANQIKMAQNAGLKVATYHFAIFGSTSNQTTANAQAQAEATYYVNMAKSLGLSSNTVMIEDAEWTSTSSAVWTQASQNFANKVKALGYNNVKFYTSKNWAENGTMKPATLGAKNFWVAQYLYGKPSASNLQNTQYGAWQYTSQMYFQGTANLRSNAVDTSIDYNDIFNGLPAGQSEVYRLYNRYTGEHFYTKSYTERTHLLSVGWQNEGIGWITSSSGTPVYRVYNPYASGGDHYYTTSKYEAQQLVKKGWRWDNNGAPAFYSNGSKNLYVAYNPNAKSGAHNYTTSAYEQNTLLKKGWKYGAVAWKVN